MTLSNPLAWEIEKGFCMANLFQITRIKIEIKQLKMVPSGSPKTLLPVFSTKQKNLIFTNNSMLTKF